VKVAQHASGYDDQGARIIAKGVIRPGAQRHPVSTSPSIIARQHGIGTVIVVAVVGNGNRIGQWCSSSDRAMEA